MAQPKTITAANAKFSIGIPALALAPFTLAGYSADAAFAFDPVEYAQVQMGVDGKMASGFVPNVKPQQVTLMANSESKAFFDAWIAGMEAIKEIALATAIIDIAAIGQSFILTNGALTSGPPGVTAGKVLGPLAYTITWESIQAVPLIGVGG